MPSFNEPTVPWVNRPVLINNPNTFVHSVNYNNYNKNQRDFINNHTQIQSPCKLVTILVPTPSSVESSTCTNTSTSPIDFEESITPIKVISKNHKDFKKLPEENNNKIHIIDNEKIKNGSISSDSSKSDTIDEKTVSYAEIIKHSKPLKSKQPTKSEFHSIEEFKKEPIKSNRIPPSKKVSIKLPDAPFLPNNQHCAFCKNNGEEESVYRTHFVKDELGNVKCPFLSRYTCPHCKATGTKAHTISRCPLSNKNRNNKFNKQQ